MLATIKQECQTATQGLLALDKLLARLETVLLFLLISILILAEIGAISIRLFWHTGFTWLEELLKYVVIWIGMLGACLATTNGRHISIEVITKLMNSRSRRLLTVVVSLAGLLITSWLACAAYHFVADKRRAYLLGRPNEVIALSNFQRRTLLAPLAVQRQRLKRHEQEIQCRLQQADSFIQEHEDWDKAAGELSQVQQLLNKRWEDYEQKGEHEEHWFTKQWQRKWKQQWERAWQQQGRVAWRKVADHWQGPPEERTSFMLSWQNQWLQRMWREHWQKQWQQYCQAHPATAGDRAKWIQQMWRTKWRQVWRRAWQTQGRAAWFQACWQKQWLSHQWQHTWQKQWQSVALPRPWSPNTDKQKVSGQIQRDSWHIPRWWLLSIMPLALLMMAWRFLLRFLQAVWLPTSLWPPTPNADASQCG